jgi:hypothetical protein
MPKPSDENSACIGTRSGVLYAPLVSQFLNTISLERTMFHKPVSGLAGIVLLLACAAGAPAQDFRVYTQIFDVRATEAAAQKNGRPRLVGRSTSLFHAGKVYDLVDSVNQMTIFEPAQQRFVIVDGPRRVLTEISFDDIENRLFQAGKSAEQHVAELDGQNTADAKRLAGQLRFQLAPHFDEEFDDKKILLKLNSRFLAYEVKCAPQRSPEVIESYLNYADWAARLNFLVNDHAMLPAPRLALNAVLRRRQLLPVEVTLRTSHQDGLHLRAVHRFDWKPDDDDRKTITDWEKLMAARNMQRVSPKKFLEPATTEKSARRK